VIVRGGVVQHRHRPHTASIRIWHCCCPRRAAPVHPSWGAFRGPTSPPTPKPSPRTSTSRTPTEPQRIADVVQTVVRRGRGVDPGRARAGVLGVARRPGGRRRSRRRPGSTAPSRSRWPSPRRLLRQPEPGATGVHRPGDADLAARHPMPVGIHRARRLPRRGIASHLPGALPGVHAVRRAPPPWRRRVDRRGCRPDTAADAGGKRIRLRGALPVRSEAAAPARR
jgi:hypothetical protein